MMTRWEKTMNNNAVVLLSGGLDSLVGLDYSIKHLNLNLKLALTFDYGQKSAEQEIKASKKICNYYKIEHKIIKLDWLKEITKTSLVSDGNIPDGNFGTQDSSSSVWVPNRNALFLNIAASFCDSEKYNYIIFGANKDEANNFPDNTIEFCNSINELFTTSTLAKPQVIAPLINYGKDDIVKIAVEDSVPLEYVRSCYNSGDKNCGKCESCYHLKKALRNNNCDKYIKLLFEEE